MTKKSRRRRSRNNKAPAPAPVHGPVSPERGFWGTIATHTSELAPVEGPLLGTIGQTATAIDRAERRSCSPEAEIRLLETDWGDENE